MATKLRIMAWNIAEGGGWGRGQGTTLQRIADNICSKEPDIVLLNEICIWTFLFSGTNQVTRLASLTGLNFKHWATTAVLGWTGRKTVAVLSRHPLQSARRIPVMRGTSETGYATLETGVLINNRIHRIFSTRFDAHNEADNIAAHQQARELIQNVDVNHSVIFGGDFNANIADDEQFRDFSRKSGLINAFDELPDSAPCTEDPQKLIDHIFYRGPYKVTQMEIRCPWSGNEVEASDHPWIFAELTERDGAGPPVTPPPFLDGMVYRTSDSADTINVATEDNAVAIGSVEFVLNAGPNIRWRKEIVIVEGASVGSGRWLIHTQDNRTTDRNGLYTHQLPGARLEFRKAKFFGIMSEVSRIGIDTVRPGSRITFTWMRD